MVSRRRAWADQRFGGAVLTAGTSIQLDLLENAPTMDTLTVVRIVMDLTAQYEVQFTVTDSLSIVDLGIGVASAAAFAVALGAGLPNPAVETEYPDRGWIYVASQPVSHVLEGSGGVGVLESHARFQVDLRAMRKIDKGILFIRLQNTNITVGGSMNVTGRVRSLVLT